MSARVVVVGSVNVDLVARSDRLPAPGETVTGAEFSRHHGGKGGNQAVAAARLGAQTTFIGALGDDEFGRVARAALEAEGIDLSGLVVIPGATGVALILVGAGGENLISVASGANAQLTPEHVERGLGPLRLTTRDVLLVGHEISTAAARSALVAGRAAGATTVLNPAPVAGLDRSVFGLADIVTPNRGELAALVAGEAERVGRPWSGTIRPEVAARTLLDRSSEGEGVRRAVVVTLGTAGAVVVAHGQQPLDLPAPVVAAIDTVGAGDAFNGALAAGLADGLELAAAARRAIAAAALATTRGGAREGMPSPAEVDALLAAS
jgi:ribokinase